MSRRSPNPAVAIVVVLALLGVLARPSSAAAPNDIEIEALVRGVLDTEYVASHFDDALAKLELAKQACEGASCSSGVRAKVFIALGTVYAGGLKKPEAARDAFANALREDATAGLVAGHVSPDIERAFEAAKGGSASGAAGASPTQSQPEPGATRTRRPFPGGKTPRGWRSGEAAFDYEQALDAEQNRLWADCASDARASFELEARATTRFLVASCEERGGRWIEAISDYEAAAELGARSGLADTAAKARSRARQLRVKVPKIVLRKPARAEDVDAAIDGVALQRSQIGGEIWANPGARVVSARGTIANVPLEFEQTVDAAEGETSVVDVVLAPKGARVGGKTLKCFLDARTRDDFNRCMNGGVFGTDDFTLRFGSELSTYHDTDHVDVVSPAVLANVENPTEGWGFGGSMLVDVVTAASADIVATASPRWREVRYVPTLSGHKKFGETDVGLHAALSREPDYLATSVGASVSTELRQKTITPSLSYDFAHDVSGRSGTPFDVFSHTIHRHGIDAASTFVIDKATILSASFTAVLEDGDTSKPYRYVPMFREGIAPLVRPGQSIDSVNAARQPERVLEQLPTNRERWAVAGRVAHRFAQSTVRLEQRLYTDSWGLKAATTDLRYLYDVTPRIRVWPHARFHGQSAVDFWQLAYVSQPTTTGTKVPALRTGDRELGPLVGLTLGAGTRVALGDGDRWAVTVAGDVVYTRFLDHLFILERFGVLGALGLEAFLE